jgi:hypothetical protein
MYQLIATAIISALLAFGTGWKVQSWRYGEQIATINATAAQAKSKAVDAALAETVRLQGVKDAALKQAETRAHDNARALAASRAESVGLRDELAIARRDLSGATCASVRDYAATASVVLDQCIGAYQEMAGKADEYAAGIGLIMSAWPTSTTRPST